MARIDKKFNAEQPSENNLYNGSSVGDTAFGQDDDYTLESILAEYKGTAYIDGDKKNAQNGSSGENGSDH